MKLILSLSYSDEADARHAGGREEEVASQGGEAHAVLEQAEVEEPRPAASNLQPPTSNLLILLLDTTPDLLMAGGRFLRRVRSFLTRSSEEVLDELGTAVNRLKNSGFGSRL